MQSSIVAGDTLKPAAVVLPDYPATAGWTLSYRLTPRVGSDAITFNATAVGAAYQVNVPAATTAAWVAGAYTCSAWITSGAERYSVASESGQVTIKPNPASLSPGTDTRSEAEVALEAITAQLRGKATAATEMYRINGRELRSYPLADLIRLESKYKAEVDAERVAAGLAPRGGVRRILVRMP